MKKIIILDWDVVAKTRFTWFPIDLELAKSLFGDYTGKWLNPKHKQKFEEPLLALFENMSKVGIEFYSPGGSEFRRLLNMIVWYYKKEMGYFNDVNPISYSDTKLEKTYELDKELFEYIYQAYCSYFKSATSFKINNDVCQLIKRKPNNWLIGITSPNKTKEEVNLLFSEQFAFREGYSDLFDFIICVDSPLRDCRNVQCSFSLFYMGEQVADYDFGSQVANYYYISAGTRSIFEDDSDNVVNISVKRGHAVSSKNYDITSLDEFKY